MAIKKSTSKKAAKKVAAKKTVKKTASKASTGSTQGKDPVRKSTTKKAAKKIVTKKPATTRIIANVDVGFGNTLYLRGEGAGLSWEKGAPLKNNSPYEWSFSTTATKGEITFKFLINDEAWADGDNLTVPAGGTSVSSPVFNW